MKTLSISILLFFATTFTAFADSKHQHSTYGDKLGTVHFEVSCNDEAKPFFMNGLALLHHMTYEGAETEFGNAIKADPDCAMGYWGQAMTYIHPLWNDPPTEDKFKKAQSLLSEARNRGKKTAQEIAYIDAADAYFSKGKNPKETYNLAGFEKGWEKVYTQFPEDLEAACFYALSQLGTADPGDKTFSAQKRAGEIVEKVLAKEPDHPGAHHYIIHAYDVPPLAPKALNVARTYGKIAPDVPHALHMPTHIFTRLGLWQESIDYNTKSGNTALHHPVGGAISLHHLHALDYLAYAYLQIGEDQKAKEVLESMRQLKGPFQVEMATPYTLAAVPARITIERKQWSEAAALKPRTPENFPWEKFPALEAITYFAKALGAAQIGNTAEAQKSIDHLKTLQDQAAAASPYWGKQVEIQRESAIAWLKYKQGQREEALVTMRHAAELEASTEKHPVTPGEIIPARELLAGMLLEMKQYKEAQTEYETALARSPNRLNGLYGAGRAAELGGDQEKAALYYKKLLEIAPKADTLEDVQKAKAFLASK